ncbi:hypothetical protein [Devosia indica]
MVTDAHKAALPHAVWREQVGRGFDRLTLEQMHRLHSLLRKMGWPTASPDEPHETLMARLTEAEQVELREIEADMAARAS